MSGRVKGRKVKERAQEYNKTDNAQPVVQETDAGAYLTSQPGFSSDNSYLRPQWNPVQQVWPYLVSLSENLQVVTQEEGTDIHRNCLHRLCP